MKQFADVLRQINARLSLPQPTKSRILLEIAGDMEDLYQALRRQGLGRDEARGEAVARFELSNEALEDLIAVHTSRWRRFLDGLSEQGRGRLERVALGLLVVFLVATTGRQALGSAFFANATALSWPALLFGLGAILVGARKAWALWLEQDHDVRRLRQGMAPILVLAGLNFLIGFFGFWFEVQVIARRLGAGEPSADLVGWLTATSATVITAMTSALICCLIWHLLEQKVTRIQQAEVTCLLQTT